MSMKFTPAASTWIATSPEPGSGASISTYSSTSGPPVCASWTARTLPELIALPSGLTCCHRTSCRTGFPSSPGLLAGSGGFAADRPAQPGHPLCQRALGTMVGGAVIVPADQLVGRVLLGDDGTRPIVRVHVALRIAQLGRAGVVTVAQRRRDRTRPAV